jgi:hypothetical protein
MSNTVVVLEVVFETPVIFEGGKTEVAVDLVIPRMVNMVLETIAVHKHAFAEIAVVFVTIALLDMTEQCGLVEELARADTTPILEWIICLLAVIVC